MKFTIIPDDKTVIIDGLGYSDLKFTIDADIHAVQWYGEIGEIEYKSELTANGVTKPNNLIINKYSAFRSALDAWETAKQVEVSDDN
jgi:hypothetical protein